MNKIVLPEPPPGWQPEDKKPKPELGDVTDRLVKMAARAVERRKALSAYAATLPPPECPHGNPHPPDIETSSQLSAGREQFQVVFSQCEACRKYGSPAMVQFLHRAGVPKKLLHASIENWQATTTADLAVIRAVRAYCANPAGMLVMFGPVGTGKTHLAVAIMRELHRGRIVTQGDILDKIRARYQDSYAENIVKRLKQLSLCVIDEMGVSSGGRDELPELHKIIDHFYSQEKNLIITTNEMPSNWAALLGDRIADRLREAQVIQFSGESKRGRKGIK